MERPLTLGALVRDAKDFADREETPFAELPWTENSNVIWMEGDSTKTIERDSRSYRYFLEPFIILEQFSNWPDSDTLVDRVIDYARTDA